jgi:hypothetical protein
VAGKRIVHARALTAKKNVPFPGKDCQDHRAIVGKYQSRDAETKTEVDVLFGGVPS